MKTVRNIPATLVERDSKNGMPPGGGLALVIAGSLVFWAAMIWIVLR